MVSDRDIVLLKCGHLEILYGRLDLLGSKKQFQSCVPCNSIEEIVRIATKEDLIQHRHMINPERLF
jgi:hypothetical protein